MDWIIKRNRPGEAGKITKEYINHLKNFYDKFFDKLKAEVEDKYLIYVDTNNKDEF